MSEKVRVATVWLDGCSGCHMSLIDMDERLLELYEHIDIVYSPLVDTKEYPEEVDVAIIEGAVSSEEDHHKALMIRERTKIIVALGDCAVDANIPAMRNGHKIDELYDRAYIETADIQPQIPTEIVPPWLPKTVPLHEVVPVDVLVQGCPPSAHTIHFVITELIAGRQPDLANITYRGA
ncbi:MAG: NADP oxidoreductase [Chloroflexi bacterium]|nr:NADP oxidoreductase [Chloroflexota bacterium]